ncbi:MBL fold metallo-hydrolase, partial [Pseudomonas aeruginosa]|uniref:MBL fold metallo-hydrolase n=1 Tax=Pseudomonas aeruginosa TaxID=287 RepID=UPI0024AFACEB
GAHGNVVHGGSGTVLIGDVFPPALRPRHGVQGERHVLLGSLAAVGLDDGDIDVVLLTHPHFAHAGGLLAARGEGQPARPPVPH